MNKMHAAEGSEPAACNGRRRRSSHAAVRDNPGAAAGDLLRVSSLETSPGVESAGALFRESTVGIVNPHLALALAVLHRALEDACGSPRSIITVHALALEAIAERDAEILAALRGGESQRDVAARYRLSKQRISSIARKARA